MGFEESRSLVLSTLPEGAAWEAAMWLFLLGLLYLKYSFHVIYRREIGLIPHKILSRKDFLAKYSGTRT